MALSALTKADLSLARYSRLRPLVARALADLDIYKEVHYWILISKYNREAPMSEIFAMVEDWIEMKRKRTGSFATKKLETMVSKFVPGDHYHVLGEKFNTLAEAIAYLERKGHQYGGFREKHVYPRDGD